MSTELNSKTYATLLQNLKKEISTARIRAHLSVNKEMITLYWSIGNQILERQKQEGWGSKVIENISKDLKSCCEIKKIIENIYNNIRIAFKKVKEC